VKETLTPMGEEHMDEWLPIDTIFCIIILFFIFVIIFILAKVAWLYLCKKQRTERKEQGKRMSPRKLAQWFVQLCKSRAKENSVNDFNEKVCSGNTIK
jgi:hypothetical protein